MGRFCESTYEEAFLQLLEENGWEYTYGEDLHRKLDETIIEDDLREYLSRKYSAGALTYDELDAIVSNLKDVKAKLAWLEELSWLVIFRTSPDTRRLKRPTKAILDLGKRPKSP